MQYSSGDVKELFNDKKVIDYLDAETLKKMKIELQSSHTYLNIDPQEYEGSYFFEKLNTPNKS